MCLIARLPPAGKVASRVRPVHPAAHAGDDARFDRPGVRGVVAVVRGATVFGDDGQASPSSIRLGCPRRGQRHHGAEHRGSRSVPLRFIPACGQTIYRPSSFTLWAHSHEASSRVLMPPASRTPRSQPDAFISSMAWRTRSASLCSRFTASPGCSPHFRASCSTALLSTFPYVPRVAYAHCHAARELGVRQRAHGVVDGGKPWGLPSRVLHGEVLRVLVLVAYQPGEHHLVPQACPSDAAALEAVLQRGPPVLLVLLPRTERLRKVLLVHPRAVDSAVEALHHQYLEPSEAPHLRGCALEPRAARECHACMLVRDQPWEALLLRFHDMRRRVSPPGASSTPATPSPGPASVAPLRATA